MTARSSLYLIQVVTMVRDRLVVALVTTLAGPQLQILKVPECKRFRECGEEAFAEDPTSSAHPSIPAVGA